jgi:hypothetical protein
LAFSSLRFSKGNTAIAFSGGLALGPELRVTPEKEEPPDHTGYDDDMPVTINWRKGWDYFPQSIKR